MLVDDSIVSGGSDNTIYVWRENPRQIWSKVQCLYHDTQVWSLSPIQDGRFVSGTVEGTIAVWREMEGSQEWEVHCGLDLSHAKVKTLR